MREDRRWRPAIVLDADAFRTMIRSDSGPPLFDGSMKSHKISGIALQAICAAGSVRGMENPRNNGGKRTTATDNHDGNLQWNSECFQFAK